MGSISSFLCFKILSLLNSPQIILASQCLIFIGGAPLDKGIPGGSDGKESACNTGDLGSVLGSGRFSWRREQVPAPIFSLGQFCGQRSLMGYNPWGRRESDMTE